MQLVRTLLLSLGGWAIAGASVITSDVYTLVRVGTTVDECHSTAYCFSSGTGVGPVEIGTASIDASAGGGWGRVDVAVNWTTMSAYGVDMWAEGRATATFRDVLTIYGGTGSGVLVVSASATANGGMVWSFNGQQTQLGGNYESRDLTIPFTFGAPILLELSATKERSGPAFGQTDGQNYGFASLGPMTISSPQCCSFGYATASGSRIMINAEQIPEPATFGLAGIGLIIIALLKRTAVKRGERSET